MKAIAGVLLVAASAIAIVMYLREGQEVSPKGVTVSIQRTDGLKVASFSPDTVLRIAPQPAKGAAPAAKAPQRSPLAQEMYGAKAWKPVYDRLRNSAEGKTAEGLYYLAQMLATCANVTDRKMGPMRRPDSGTPEEARTRFSSSISEKDPNRAARLAAYDVNAMGERCNGLREVATTEKEIRDLREQAMNAGDPKARALLTADEIFASAKPGTAPPANLPSITDAQLESLRQAARSGDPAAVQIVGSVLASTMGDLNIRAGPSEQPVDPRAFHDAWVLASCELGASCGPDNRRVASACAYEGQCGVDNLRDWYFYYGHSPAQSQMVGQYSQQILNAIRTGDWSYFQFARGAPSGAGHSVFRFGHGG